MEKRVITLEVRTEQIEKSIDRLDHSISDLKNDMDKRFVHLENLIENRFSLMDKKIDRKFFWTISIQITSLIAMMSYIGKITNQF